MKVDPDVVRTIADLAKLRLNPEDMEINIDRMTRILDLVSQMETVPTDDIEPMAHPLDALQRLRPDLATAQVDRDKYQAIAPETSDGLYLVPRVVD